MTYEVPVFVTDSALSFGEERSAGPHKVLTSAALLSYVAQNPGLSPRQLGRVFGMQPKQISTRLCKLRDRGCLESRGTTVPNAPLIWFATGVPFSTPKHRFAWSDHEKATLRTVWPVAPSDEVLAALPARTWEGCIEQAFRMDLKRKRNIGRDMLALQMARNQKAVSVGIPPVTAPAIVRKAIASMTPLEAAWMGRLAA